MSPEPHELDPEFADLFDKTIEGTLSDSEADSLREQIKESSATRQSYLEYMNLHASLHWQNVPVSDDDNRDFVSCAGGPRSVRVRPHGNRRVRSAALAAAALLTVGVVVAGWTTWQAHQASAIVATLATTKSCSWGDGTLPTSAGSELTAGRLALRSGLAEIRFASGALVSLEGPAEIDLVDPMSCILRKGTLVADVPPSAEGFRVNTDRAAFVDYGTRFGVVVDAATKEAEVQVFEGIVDVEHRSLAKPERLTEGERAIVNQEIVEKHKDRDHQFQDKVDSFADAQIVTTADGRGQEGYVRERKPRASIFETRFVVKASEFGMKHHSKAFMSFDLSAAASSKINAARFRIQAIPSPRGYASHVPDATFAVYGLLDGESDFWTGGELKWETAPGNIDGPGADPASTALLGRFQIPQGADSGFFTVEGDELVRFLRQDTNNVATLILVRETLETEVRGLAHTFARRRTPDAVPPMLLLVTE